MELSNKVAFITGGARIGMAVAEALAKKGCHVALTYRHSKDSAEETAEKVRNQGSNALILKTDVTNESQMKRTAEKVFKNFGRLDILVNMASKYQSIPLKKLTENNWQENIAADLTSARLGSVHCAPYMLKNGQGRIINISDWLAASGRPRYINFAPYYVAKSGVIGLTQMLALELAPKILVNCIAPGPILAPNSMKSRDWKAVKAVTPLKRWGGPEEIARTVIFLCETDFVTGEVIRVDGGRHLF